MALKTHTIRTAALLVFASLVALTMTACTPGGPAWTESGTSYTKATVTELYSKADISKLATAANADVPKLRHEALAALRNRGGAASDAADTITNTFPTDTHGVPAYVEKAKFDDTPALIIIEAIGPANGKLTTERLWALSKDGAVLFVGTRKP